MHEDRGHLADVLCWSVTLAYFSLVVWMHIWALQVGLPNPGEQSATTHHQVCTWIGTSGEAAVVSCGPITPSQPIAWFNSPSPPLRPVRPVPLSSVQPRAPPFPFVVSESA